MLHTSEPHTLRTDFTCGMTRKKIKNECIFFLFVATHDVKAGKNVRDAPSGGGVADDDEDEWARMQRKSDSIDSGACL